MIIKKFIGKNEEEATKLAKADLGENLVIMNVRKVKAKPPFAFLKSKRVELTAAVEEDDPSMEQLRRIARAQVSAQEKEKNASSVKPSGGVVSIKPQALDSSKSIEEKLDNLQNILEKKLGSSADEQSVSAPEKEEVKESIPRSEPDTEEPKNAEEGEKDTSRFLRLLYNTMIDNDIDEKLVNELVNNAGGTSRTASRLDQYLSAVYQKMILRFGKADGIMEKASKGPVIIFFIGPTGVGKTTTIAKVASSLSVNEKKKVALLTTDTYRIAAADQLRTYASILEVPFRVIYSEDELLLASEDFKDCDYILVDTAGHSHKSDELLARQKSFLDCLPESMTKQCFLVLSATTKYRDLKKIVDKYKAISEFQLIFTKLDETSTLGNLYNMRCYSDSPIAFVTCGQNVPDDIEIFNAQRIVKQLLGGD